MTQAPTNAFRPGYVYNPADAPPTTFYSPTAEANQRALEEARRKAQAPDFLDAVVAAADESRTVPLVSSFLSTEGFPPDPNFRPTKDTFDKAAIGIDYDLQRDLGRARSQVQLDAIAAELRKKTDRRRVLADAGYTGVAATLLEGITDPPAAAAGLLSGGLGFGSRAAALGRAGRIASMVEGGFLNAAPFAAVEGVKFAVKPDGDIRDVVIGALSGAAGGAATSALSEAGVLARMAGVGAAAAAPEAGARLFYASDERTQADIIMGTATQFLINAVAGGATPHSARLERVGQALAKDAHAADIRAAAAARGKTPAEIMSPKAYVNFANYDLFRDSLDTTAQKAFDAHLRFRADVAIPTDVASAKTFGLADILSEPAKPTPAPAEVTLQTLLAKDPAAPVPVDQPFVPPANENLGQLLVRSDLQAQSRRILGEPASPAPNAPKLPDVPKPGFEELAIARQQAAQQAADLNNQVNDRIRAAYEEINSQIRAGKKPSDAVRDVVATKFGETFEPPKTGQNVPNPSKPKIPKTALDADPAEAIRKPPKAPAPEVIASAGSPVPPSVPETVPTALRKVYQKADDAEKRAREYLKSAGIQRRPELKTPGGSRSGAVIDPVGHVAAVATIAASRVVKGGVRTLEAIDAAIKATLAEFEGSVQLDEAQIRARTQELLNAATPANESAFANAVPEAVQNWKPKDVNSFDGSRLNDDAWDLTGWRVEQGAYVGDQTMPPEARFAANSLFYDPLLKKGGKASVGDAKTWALAQVNREYARYIVKRDAAYKAHVKAAREAGIEPMSDEAFGKAVTRAVVADQVGSPQIDPNVSAAAKAMQDIGATTLLASQQHRVPGSLDVPNDPTWVHRVWDGNAIEALSANKDTAIARAEEVIRGAILAETPDTKPAVADSISRTIVKRALFGSSGRGGAYGADDIQLEEIQNLLREQGVSQATIDQTAKILTPRKAEPGTPATFRSRVRLDENYVHTFEDGTKLSLNDLLVRDDLHLVNRELHTAYGNAAKHEMFAAFNERFNANVTSEDQLLRTIEERMRRADVPQATINKNMERLQFGLNNLAGRRLRPEDPLDKIASDMAKFQRFRVLSNVGTGVQNLEQVLRVIGDQGLEAAFKSLPAFPEMITFFKRGDIDRAAAQEAEAIGISVQRLTRRRTPRGVDPNEGTRMNTARRGLDTLDRFSGDISLQSYTQDLAETVADTMTRQKIDLAATGKGLSLKRQKALGWSPEETARIVQQVKKYRSNVDGVWAANEHLWDDVGAAAIYRQGVLKNVLRLTSGGDPTDKPLWMSAPIGKLFGQLRSWGLSQWSRNFLYTAQVRDAGTVAAAASSIVGTGLLYGARVYLNSVGREDAQDYRENMLTDERIVLAALGKNSFVNVIPGAIDFAAPFAGYDPVFSFARTSGIQGGDLRSTPVGDFAFSAASAAAQTARAIYSEDYVFSQQTADNYRRAFLPNIFGVQQMMQRFTESLPTRSE